MPRIPETEIERIKRQTDLAALVRARGVELDRQPALRKGIAEAEASQSSQTPILKEKSNTPAK